MNSTLTHNDMNLGLSSSRGRKRSRGKAIFTKETCGTAIKEAFVMLRPDIQWKNPVMFVVEIGAFLTLIFVIQAALGKSSSQVSISYFIALDVWLFLTVLFANFATALAEAHGKAQADSLRRTRRDTVAHRLRSGGTTEDVSSTELKVWRLRGCRSRRHHSRRRRDY